MKTQTVRQISTSTVPSRQVHEALVHSKKQAKRTIDTHTHTMTAGMIEIPAEEKNPKTLLHDNAWKIPHCSITSFDQSSLTTAATLEFLPHDGPFSQYEVLKQHWDGYFLKSTKEIA